jgi:hypothetical protein
MTWLLVWRHGRTEWNASDRTQGHSDVDLDEAGLEQAVAAAPRLAAYAPDLIVSSDLSRAARTADALAALTGLTVERDARLRERYFGPWQGLTQDEIRSRYPTEYVGWSTASVVGDLDIESVDDRRPRQTRRRRLPRRRRAGRVDRHGGPRHPRRLGPGRLRDAAGLAAGDLAYARRSRQLPPHRVAALRRPRLAAGRPQPALTAHPARRAVSPPMIATASRMLSL